MRSTTGDARASRNSRQSVTHSVKIFDSRQPGPSTWGRDDLQIEDMRQELSKATINARRSVAVINHRLRGSEGMKRASNKHERHQSSIVVSGAPSREVSGEDEVAMGRAPSMDAQTAAATRAVSVDTEEPETEDHSGEDQMDDTLQKELDELGFENEQRAAYIVVPMNPCLEFVDQLQFQGFILVIITLNIYCLAGETDNPEWIGWGYLNGFFLIVYCGEIILRILYLGPLNSLWFDKEAHRWMWYELFVVILGVLDLVVASLSRTAAQDRHSYSAHTAAIAAATNHVASIEDTTGLSSLESVQSRRLFTLAEDAPLTRLLMLSRLCRLFRIIRFVEPLRVRVKLLINMLVNTMWWIFVTIFVFCFIMAIILTRMLGHGLVVNENSPNAAQVQKMFADIPTSLFTLFQLTTVDDWAKISTPIISMSDEPLVRLSWRLFFIGFITFMSWTMLSLLTAVASETMISNTSRSKADEIVRQELMRQDFITFLCAEFMRADADCNGVLDKEEFQILMSQPMMKQELKWHGISEEEKDIMRTWDTFDVDESGALTIEELVDGFSVLQEGLATKHVASIAYSLQHWRHKLETDFDALEEGAEKLEQQQREVIQHTINQQKEIQEQWAQLWQQAQGAPAPAQDKVGSPIKDNI